MWVDVEQNTDEWYALRLKKITSSNFGVVMANDGKSFGKPAIEYAERIALEINTGLRNDEDDFKSVYMERGSEYEDTAKRLYEMETFRKVRNGGFFFKDDLGDSPDGIIGESGRAEIKCVKASTQWKRIKKGGYDTAYKWQIQGHLWIGDAEWCDFIQYSPKMPKNKQIYIFRVHRDEEMISRMKDRMDLFRKEIENNLRILES